MIALPIPMNVPSDALLVRPYVQLGQRADAGTGSVALVWHVAAGSEDTTLRYRSEGGDWRTAPVSEKRIEVPTAAVRLVRSATLDRLPSGGTVLYRLDRAGHTIADGTFIAPKSSRQPYRFAVFGDCGIGSLAQARISGQTLRQKPDLLVMTGDLVYSRGRIEEYDRNFWPYYTGRLPLMSSTLTVSAPGNHDILYNDLGQWPDGLAYFHYWSQPLNGPIREAGAKGASPIKGPDATLDAFKRSAGANFPVMANFSFDYANAHWTVLDANPYVDWSDPSLRKWVADDLKKGAKKTWRFVVYHHPGFQSSKTHQEYKNMRLIADLFEEGGVDVVFNGHVHNYQRSHPILVGPKKGAPVEELKKDDWPLDKRFDGVRVTRKKGVLYVVDGAGGAGLYNPEQDTKPGEWKPFTAEYKASVHSFSVVDIDGRTFRLRQIDASGKEIDRWTLTK